MSFEFLPLEINDVILIRPKIHEDERGFFIETYKKTEFKQNGIDVEFNQDNYSKSSHRVLRGLHFQRKPFEQAKLVRCTKGKIYDIAVDIRPESITFKKYVKVELSEENKNMLFIPKGFAHGFVALSEDVEINYKTSNEYNKDSECGIIWSDKDLNIDWGIDFEPILSNKDLNLSSIKEIKL